MASSEAIRIARLFHKQQFSKLDCQPDCSFIEELGEMLDKELISTQWIKCSERMPEEDIRVIVYILKSSWASYFIACGEIKDGHWFVEDERVDFASITHWMLLPEAPKV
jgi:hypothetical protein